MDRTVRPVDVQAIERDVVADPQRDLDRIDAGNDEVDGLSSPSAHESAVGGKLRSGMLIEPRCDSSGYPPTERRRCEPVRELETSEAVVERVEHLIGEPLEAAPGLFALRQVGDRPTLLNEPRPRLTALDQVAVREVR